jgi:hypothetical protein
MRFASAAWAGACVELATRSVAPATGTEVRSVT